MFWHLKFNIQFPWYIKQKPSLIPYSAFAYFRVFSGHPSYNGKCYSKLYTRLPIWTVHHLLTTQIRKFASVPLSGITVFTNWSADYRILR